MGSGHHLSFHLHIPHLMHHHHHQHHHQMEKKDQMRGIPKGCLAIMVGQDDDHKERFVIPVIYINHPLFMKLLKEAEEEYGFDHQGPITIPCQVEDFRTVQDRIDQDESLHHHLHQPHHHHHNHHHVWCFRV